jgi:hypothetical protein
VYAEQERKMYADYFKMKIGIFYEGPLLLVAPWNKAFFGISPIRSTGNLFWGAGVQRTREQRAAIDLNTGGLRDF